MNLILYGISLTALALAITKAAQSEAKLSDNTARYLRAGLLSVAFLIISFKPELEALLPDFVRIVTVVSGVISIFLGSLGYWPDIQRVGNRIQGL